MKVNNTLQLKPDIYSTFLGYKGLAFCYLIFILYFILIDLRMSC